MSELAKLKTRIARHYGADVARRLRPQGPGKWALGTNRGLVVFSHRSTELVGADDVEKRAASSNAALLSLKPLRIKADTAIEHRLVRRRLQGARRSKWPPTRQTKRQSDVHPRRPAAKPLDRILSLLKEAEVDATVVDGKPVVPTLPLHFRILPDGISLDCSLGEVQFLEVETLIVDATPAARGSQRGRRQRGALTRMPAGSYGERQLVVKRLRELKKPVEAY